MKYQIPLAEADRLAASIVATLKPFCARFEIAGSIRRRVPSVGDIDLVLLPNPCDLPALRQRITQNKEVIQDGPQNVYVRLQNAVELNAFLARPEERDFFGAMPSNFGSLLMLRTGPREFNIALVEFAKLNGFEWKTTAGLFRDGKCVAAETEEDIFQALDLTFIRPVDRDVARTAGFFPFAPFKLSNSASSNQVGTVPARPGPPRGPLSPICNLKSAI